MLDEIAGSAKRRAVPAWRQSKRQAHRSMRQDSSFFTQAGLAGEESPLQASNDASHERWHCCVQFA